MQLLGSIRRWIYGESDPVALFHVTWVSIQIED